MGDAASGRPSRRHRWWRWPLRALLALGVVLAILYFGRTRLVAPFLIDFAERAAADALGAEVEIGELGGSWFGGIEARHIRTRGDATRTLVRHLEIDEAVAEYSLWELVRGHPDWFHQVRVRGVRAELDLRQGGGAERAGDGAAAAAPFSAPPWLPPIALDEVAVELLGDDLGLRVPVARLQSTRGAAGSHRFELHAAIASFVAGGARLDDASIVVRADWAGTALALTQVELEMTRGAERLRLDGRVDLARLDGTVEVAGLEIEPFLAAAGLALAGRVDLQAELGLTFAEPWAAAGEFDLTASELRGFGIDVASLRSAGRFGGGELRDGRIELSSPEGQVELTQLALPLDPALSAADLARRAEGELALRVPRLAELLARFGVRVDGLPDILGECEIAASQRDGAFLFAGTGATGAAGTLRLDGLRFTLGEAGTPLGAHDLVLPLAFDLGPDWLPGGGTPLPPLRGRATLVLDAPLALDGVPERLLLGVEDLELQTAAGTLVLEAALPLALGAAGPLGEGEIHARGSVRDCDFAALAPLLGDVVLPLAAGRADLSWEIGGSWDEPTLVIDLNGEDWILRAPPSEHAGPAGPFRVAAALSYAAGRVELASCEIDGAGLRASSSGEWAVPLDLRAWLAGAAPDFGGTFAARASVSSAELDWLAALAPELRPSLAAGRVELALSGTLADPVLSVDAALDGLRVGAEPGPPLQFALRAHHAGQRFTIEECRLSGAEQSLALSGVLPLAPDAAAPLAPGPLDLRLSLDRFDLTAAAALAAPFATLPPLAGTLTAELRLDGDWSEPRVAAELHGEGLWASLPAWEQEPEPITLDAAVDWSAGTVTLRRLDARAHRLVLDGDGTLALAADPRAMLAGQRPELGPLALRGRVEAADLSWLAALPAIQRAEGAARAEIDLRGPLDALVYEGRLELDGGALRLDNPTLGAFEALRLRGRFDHQTVEIDELRGELGAEPFVVSGRVRWAGVAEPELDLALSGDDLLLYRNQGIKLRANAELKVQGPLSTALVSGRIKVTDGRMVQNVDFLRVPVGAPAPPKPGGIQLFSLAPPLDRLRFDVAVRSTNQGFQVANNVLRGALRPELRLTGTGAVPVLLGEVYVDRMIMELPATRLLIEQSVVRFLESDPFRPRLSLRGGMERYGYQVEILVTGPYDRPEVIFSSTPPLGQEELLVLVSTGQPPAERIDTEGAISAVAIYLARDFLSTFLGSESTEAEESILDRLEVYTGRDTTRQGEETIEGRFRLRDRFLFDDDSLYLESEKDSYGDFNLGLKLLIRFP